MKEHSPEKKLRLEKLELLTYDVEVEIKEQHNRHCRCYMTICARIRLLILFFWI